MKEIKLCLCGELRSGKSTVGDYLEKKYQAMPFAFGDDLKKDFHKEYPHVPREPKPRKGYQLYGQFMRYVYGEDYWVDKCFDKISQVRTIARAYKADMFLPMITDARQPNEFERCREENFIIIKVWAPEEIRIQRAREAGDNFSLEDLNHETELHIKDVEADYLIENTCSLEELYDRVDDIINDIQSRLK